jgi:hypothetical protein
MLENPRLFTNDDKHTCRNQNQIKMKLQTSTQDNVLRMNMNSGCPENPAYTVKPKKKHFRPPNQALFLLLFFTEYILMFFSLPSLVFFFDF